MAQAIDWYAHYKQKVGDLSFKRTDLDKFYVQNRKLIEYIISLRPKEIIEAGAGLARDAFVLADRDSDVSVTLFDVDEKLLKIAQANATRLGLNDRIEIVKGDLFQLFDSVPHHNYDICFSCGVLEHFEDSEIHDLLVQQLNTASTVVFTVPIRSEANLRYFTDDIYRRMLTPEEWIQILAPFEIKQQATLRGRHEDLLITLVAN